MTKTDVVNGQLANDELYQAENVQESNPTFAKLLTNPSQSPNATATIASVPTVVLAKINHIDELGQVWVDISPFAVGQVMALTTCPILAEHIGQQCAVQFVMGNIAQPLIIGMLLQSPAGVNQASEKTDTPATIVQIDNTETQEILHLRAQKEIILECGESYIRLTDEGVVEIRGIYVSSNAVATQRLRGGSVLVN